MSRLLPLQFEKEIRADYLRRAAAVALFLLAAAFLVGSVALLPGIVLLSGNDSPQATRKQSDIPPLPELSAFQQRLDQRLAEAEGAGTVNIESSLTALSASSSGVHFRGMSFEGNMVEVRGVAESRSSLAAFVKSLEEGGRFAKVEAPLSLYAKDKDIDFDISLNLKK